MPVALFALAGVSQWLSYRLLHRVCVRLEVTPGTEDSITVTHLTLLGTGQKTYPRSCRASAIISAALISLSSPADASSPLPPPCSHRLCQQQHADSTLCSARAQWLGDEVLPAAQGGVGQR